MGKRDLPTYDVVLYIQASKLQYLNIWESSRIRYLGWHFLCERILLFITDTTYKLCNQVNTYVEKVNQYLPFHRSSPSGGGKCHRIYPTQPVSVCVCVCVSVCVCVLVKHLKLHNVMYLNQETI